MSLEDHGLKWPAQTGAKRFAPRRPEGFTERAFLFFQRAVAEPITVKEDKSAVGYKDQITNPNQRDADFRARPARSMARGLAPMHRRAPNAEDRAQWQQ